MSEADVVITQVMALGRGVEANSDPFPGTVQEWSPHSGDSYDRAVTATRYAQANPAVKRVVFSGNIAFMVPECEQPGSSEAEGMEYVARKRWAQIPSKTERKSLTTFGNFAESVRAGLLDPSEVTGIVVDEAQRRNAVRVARLVMPGTVIRVISSRDNPDLKATLPDTRIDTDQHPMRPTFSDRVSAAAYRVAMLGVTPGDLDLILKRDQLVQRNVLRVVRVGRAMLSALSSYGEPFVYDA